PNARFTPATISFTVISPSPFASPALQAADAAVPNATFTMAISSFTVTSPSPLQSPPQVPVAQVVDAELLSSLLSATVLLKSRSHRSVCGPAVAVQLSPHHVT